MHVVQESRGIGQLVDLFDFSSYLFLYHFKYFAYVVVFYSPLCLLNVILEARTEGSGLARVEKPTAMVIDLRLRMATNRLGCNFGGLYFGGSTMS